MPSAENALSALPTPAMASATLRCAVAAFLRATRVVAVRSPSSILRFSSATCCFSFSLVACALCTAVCMHGHLLVALGFLGQRLLGQVFVAGVQRHAGAVLPLLRLADILLILGVQAVVVAHRHGGSLHHVVQLGPHVGHGLVDGRFESGVFHDAHALVGLAAGHAAQAAEHIS